MTSACDSCSSSYMYNPGRYGRGPGFLPVINREAARMDEIAQLGYTHQPLPLGATRIGPVGFVQTSRDDQWQRASYYNFLRAQSLPYEVAFSGVDQVCTTCPPNYFAIDIPSAAPTRGIPVDYQPLLAPGRPIATAESALPPVNLPRFGARSFGAYTGCTQSRMPYLGFL